MNEDLFIKYYDNELTDEEKKLFEISLHQNENLMKAYSNFVDKQNKLKELTKINVNTAYFNNMPVKIHQKLSKEKKKFIIKSTAVGLSFSVLVIFFISIYNYNSISNNTNMPIINRSIESTKVNNSNTGNFITNLNSNSRTKTNKVQSPKFVTYNAIEDEDIELSENDIDEFIDQTQSIKILKSGK